MLLKIGLAKKPAVLLHEFVDLVCDLALVKSVAPFFADESQGARQRGIFEDVAFAGRAAFAVESVGLKKSAGQTLVELGTEMPVERDQLGNRKAFFRVMDRRRQIVR